MATYLPVGRAYSRQNHRRVPPLPQYELPYLVQEPTRVLIDKLLYPTYAVAGATAKSAVPPVLA